MVVGDSGGKLEGWVWKGPAVESRIGLQWSLCPLLQGRGSVSHSCHGCGGGRWGQREQGGGRLPLPLAQVGQPLLTVTRWRH